MPDSCRCKQKLWQFICLAGAVVGDAGLWDRADRDPFCDFQWSFMHGPGWCR